MAVSMMSDAQLRERQRIAGEEIKMRKDHLKLMDRMGSPAAEIDDAGRRLAQWKALAQEAAAEARRRQQQRQVSAKQPGWAAKAQPDKRQDHSGKAVGQATMGVAKAAGAFVLEIVKAVFKIIGQLFKGIVALLNQAGKKQDENQQQSQQDQGRKARSAGQGIDKAIAKVVKSAWELVKKVGKLFSSLFDWMKNKVKQGAKKAKGKGAVAWTEKGAESAAKSCSDKTAGGQRAAADQGIEMSARAHSPSM